MAESNFTYDTLNVLLFEWFPILETPEYLKLTDYLEDLGPYVVFGILFNRYIEDVVISETPADRARIGGFLENMSKTKDGNVGQLLKLEILPTLWNTQRNIDTYWEYLGTNTRLFLTWLAPKHAPRILLPSD